jgi:hypothetical protein
MRAKFVLVCCDCDWSLEVADPGDGLAKATDHQEACEPRQPVPWPGAS